MTKQKLIYTSPRSEVIALHVESLMQTISFTDENVDGCETTSGLDFDDEDLWD